MAFTLWGLLEASLLLVNAICILHEERFLAKGKATLNHNYVYRREFKAFSYLNKDVFSLVGWGGEQVQAYGSGPSVKSQILNLIRSVRTVMRSKLYY